MELKTLRSQGLLSESEVASTTPLCFPTLSSPLIQLPLPHTLPCYVPGKFMTHFNNDLNNASGSCDLKKSIFQTVGCEPLVSCEINLVHGDQEFKKTEIELSVIWSRSQDCRMSAGTPSSKDRVNIGLWKFSYSRVGVRWGCVLGHNGKCISYYGSRTKKCLQAIAQEERCRGH